MQPPTMYDYKGCTKRLLDDEYRSQQRELRSQLDYGTAQYQLTSYG